MTTNDAHPPTGENALAEALQRSRRRLRVVSGLLALALVGAGVMAALWLDAAAESRRAAEQARDAEQAREEERARTEADTAREVERIRAEAERARAEADAARRRVAAFEYARAVQLAHQAMAAQNTLRAHELLEGVPPAPRGWEWRYIAPPPRAKE
jgi:hypothetical protein